MNETKEKILDAAEKGMRLYGYHALSFRDLADELGIKSSSVHYHFRSKEVLGVALVERYTERFFEALDGTKSDDPVLAIRSIYRGSLKTSDTLCLCGMLGAESAGLPEEVATAVSSFFDENIVWVSERLAKTESTSRRKSHASHVVATLQGAMMIASSLGDERLFDRATGRLSMAIV